MTDKPALARTPRRSITKTQLQTPAGAELLSLCQTMTEDGRITETEITDLRDWLTRNRDSGLPSEDFLTATVERILADGRVTPDELQELHEALETVLPPELRKGAQASRRAAEVEDRRRRAEEKAAAIRSVEADVPDEPAPDWPVEEYDFMVTGVMHEGRADIVRELLDADDPPLTAYLARDAGNQYSRHAVQVRIYDGRVIGYVPEMTENIRARDVARHLDAGAKHRAWIKRILTGGRAPIPIVVAEIFDADSLAEGAVTQAEVPGSQSAGGHRTSKGCVIIGLILIALLGILAILIALKPY